MQPQDPNRTVRINDPYAEKNGQQPPPGMDTAQWYAEKQGYPTQPTRADYYAEKQDDPYAEKNGAQPASGAGVTAADYYAEKQGYAPMGVDPYAQKQGQTSYADKFDIAAKSDPSADKYAAMADPYAQKTSTLIPLDNPFAPAPPASTRRAVPFWLLFLPVVLLLVVGGVAFALVSGNPSQPTAQAATATPLSGSTPNSTSAAAATTAPGISALPTTTPMPGVTQSPAAKPTATPINTGEKSPEQLYDEGKAALDKQDWDAAITLYLALFNRKRDYLNTAAQLTSAYYGRAVNTDRAVEPKDDYDATIRSIDKSLADLNEAKRYDPAARPDIQSQIDREEAYKKGTFALHDHRWEDAVNAFKLVYGLDPNHRFNTSGLLYKAYMGWGDKLAETDKQKALAQYDEARKLNPLSGEERAAADQKYQDTAFALTPTPVSTATARPFPTAIPIAAPTATPLPIPTVTVPGVVNFTFNQASSQLSGLGLAVAATYACNDSYAAGYVFDQNPSGGASVLRGATVTLFVSNGSCTPPTPSVRYANVPDIVTYAPRRWLTRKLREFGSNCRSHTWRG